MSLLNKLSEATMKFKYSFSELVLNARHLAAHYRNKLKDLSLYLLAGFTDIKSVIEFLHLKRLRTHFELLKPMECTIGFSYKGRKILLKILDEKDMFTVYEIFFKGLYALLNVKGRTVLDIGAYIGDSSIYFALNGAKRVIAIEPNIRAFKCLVDNVKINNLDHVVEPLNKAINNVLDLESVISSISEPLVVKVDCEGCEYKVLKDELSKSITDYIEEIILEYHRWMGSPLQLIHFLRKRGYCVRVIIKSKNLGTIYAKRRE